MGSTIDDLRKDVLEARKKLLAAELELEFKEKALTQVTNAEDCYNDPRKLLKG